MIKEKKLDFELKIFDKEEYLNLINETKCFSKTSKIHYYNDNNTAFKFYKKLLKLSNNHCFYCGEKLYSNNLKSIYFEREHIIDKKIFPDNSKEFKTLLHCKKNLIPICKNCNSIKTFRERHEVKSYIPQYCNIDDNCMNVLDLSSKYNFDLFGTIYFDLLNLKFYSNTNSEKIRNLKLNHRIGNYFSSIFELLYEININLDKNKRNVLFHSIVNNKIEEKFIDFIEEYNLLNTYKLQNLIETITLLTL